MAIIQKNNVLVVVEQSKRTFVNSQRLTVLVDGSRIMVGPIGWEAVKLEVDRAIDRFADTLAMVVHARIHLFLLVLGLLGKIVVIKVVNIKIVCLALENIQLSTYLHLEAK